MTFTSFTQTCLQNTALIGHQGADYFKTQAVRFYMTYQLCRKYLRPRCRLLSIGAGSAYVEAILGKELCLKVTVVDLPEAIELNKSYYDKLGFTVIAGDLLREKLPVEAQSFDAVLCAEIVEHLPQAPSILFGKVAQMLNAGGHLIVSTPNLASLPHIVKLLFMRPIIAPPEETFAVPSFENEGTHRREYVPREIIEAMNATGISLEMTRYFRYFQPKSPVQRTLFFIYTLVPRFQPGMIVVGRK
jgi:2-polyprenyl-3-methyl-5-hydroxy-6-metoxy-1,4-benzoquinol methylase